MKKKRRLPFEETPSLDISSLVDISFLLLIFFLVTSTIQKSEADLTTTLAGEQQSGPSEPPQTIDINLEKDGIIRVDGEIATDLLSRLQERANLAKLTDSKQLAVIIADDEAPHQRLVDILDALTAAEIQTITLNGFKK